MKIVKLYIDSAFLTTESLTEVSASLSYFFIYDLKIRNLFKLLITVSVMYVCTNISTSLREFHSNAQITWQTYQKMLLRVEFSYKPESSFFSVEAIWIKTTGSCVEIFMLILLCNTIVSNILYLVTFSRLSYANVCAGSRLLGNANALPFQRPINSKKLET